MRQTDISAVAVAAAAAVALLLLLMMMMMISNPWTDRQNKFKPKTGAVDTSHRFLRSVCSYRAFAVRKCRLIIFALHKTIPPFIRCRI